MVVFVEDSEVLDKMILSPKAVLALIGGAFMAGVLRDNMLSSGLNVAL